MRRILPIALLSAATTLVSCLPADTRPEPGRVYVTAQLPEELQGTALTFQTDDGWTVTLEVLMVSLGRLELQGENCNDYSQARYQRVLDLREPGAQKVAQVWGLDDCRLGYAVSIPEEEDAVLGANVTEEDRAFMSKANVPVPSLSSGVVTQEGMALHVAGTVAKDDVAVRFDWGFPASLDWGDCKRYIDGTFEDVLPLKGGETIKVQLVIDPRKLFVLNETSLAQGIVDADQVNGNANGRVAVDELVATAVSDYPLNLGLMLQTRSYPSMFLYDGDGVCTLNAERSGHGPGML